MINKEIFIIFEKKIFVKYDSNLNSLLTVNYFYKKRSYKKNNIYKLPKSYFWLIPSKVCVFIDFLSELLKDPTIVREVFQLNDLTQKDF